MRTRAVWPHVQNLWRGRRPKANRTRDERDSRSPVPATRRDHQAWAQRSSPVARTSRARGRCSPSRRCVGRFPAPPPSAPRVITGCRRAGRDRQRDGGSGTRQRRRARSHSRDSKRPLQSHGREDVVALRHKQRPRRRARGRFPPRACSRTASQLAISPRAYVRARTAAARSRQDCPLLADRKGAGHSEDTLVPTQA